MISRPGQVLAVAIVIFEDVKHYKEIIFRILY